MSFFLARPVGLACVNNDDCDSTMECQNKKCQCRNGHETVNVNDILNVELQRCVVRVVNGKYRLNKNLLFIYLFYLGVDRIKFQSILFIFILFIRFFF